MRRLTIDELLLLLLLLQLASNATLAWTLHFVLDWHCVSANLIKQVVRGKWTRRYNGRWFGLISLPQLSLHCKRHHNSQQASIT